MIDGFLINKSQGFIKLYRSFIKWEWYDDANTVRLFIHCLLSANHEMTKWHGYEIARGSFITSYGNLAKELNLTVKEVRTSLKHLQKTNEIKLKTNNHFSYISINNFEEYQEKGKPKNNNDRNNEHIEGIQGTSNGQTIDKQTANNGQEVGTQGATNKNEKNDKNDKNNNKVDSLKHKNFVAKSFFQKLIAEDEKFKEYSPLKDLFIEFLEYKTQIKKQYKTENSVRNAFLAFVRLSNCDLDYARALVDNTIARGWQSIYDLPKEQKASFKKVQGNKPQNEDWESRCM